MNVATQIYHPRIAVVFDFDQTLAPSSADALLARCGVDPAAWRREVLDPLLDDGWDQVLALVHGLVDLSQSGRGPRITRKLVEEVGRNLPPFDGVPEMFARLRGVAHAVAGDITVEFHLISSGLVDVVRATPIADEFEHLWGTELHFGPDDSLVCAKAMVSHPEKIRYLLALAKGMPAQGPNAPADVYRSVADEDWHVPLSQVVYVGDGASDMPVFGLLNDRGGLAIGVYKEDAQSWPKHADTHAGRRVQNLARTDFRPDSELIRSLDLAVSSIAHRIALLSLGRRE